MSEPDDHQHYRYLNFAGMRVRVDSYRMAVVQDGEWEHFFEWKIWAAMTSQAAEPDAATVEACARAAYDAGHGGMPRYHWDNKGDLAVRADVKEQYRAIARAVLAAAGLPANGAGR